MTANWDTSYKTKINGQVINLGDLFSKNANASNPSVSISTSLGGNNYKWNNAVFNSNPTAGQPAGIVARNNTFHNGKIGGAHGHRPNGNYGFNDGQTNVGFKYNGNDIGPNCSAKYFDVTSSTGFTQVPEWVDYYQVICVGKGGLAGGGRNTNDKHNNSPLGGTGGLLFWKSPTNLGKTNKKIKVVIGNYGQFQVNHTHAGSTYAYCRGLQGLKGNNVHGNDGNDVHNATTYGGLGGGYQQSGGAHIYGHKSFQGQRGNENYNTQQHATNAIAEAIIGWHDKGRAASWEGGEDDNGELNIGGACVRYYPIAYNEF